MKLRTATLGFPCLGDNGLHPFTLDKFLTGKIEANELYRIGSVIRKKNIGIQKSAGIDIIPSNDFTWHDHVWDVSLLLGNVPSRYYWEGGEVPSDIYFAPIAGHRKDKFEVSGMEFRPWFNTKLMYTVPEFQDATDFIQSDNKIAQHYIEAMNFGVKTRPVILGPMTYILVGKVFDSEDGDFTEIDIEKTLHEILDVYSTVFLNLKRIGVKEVQIDEPCLSTDLSNYHQKLIKDAFSRIRSVVKDDMHITLTTGYSDVGSNADMVFSLPVDCVHLDLCSAPWQIDLLKSNTGKEISLGIVDGQSVFINDLQNSIHIVESVLKSHDAVQIAPSTALYHCPQDLRLEEEIVNSEAGNFLSFAVQKIDELNLIKNYFVKNNKQIQDAIDERSARIKNLKEKLAFSAPGIPDYKRELKRTERLAMHKENFGLKYFPFTSLGSFAQTGWNGNVINDASLGKKADSQVTEQDKLGFDIVSAGEVGGFMKDAALISRLMDGCILSTKHGYIKTYCNIFDKPPIIFGNFSLNEDLAKSSGSIEIISRSIELTSKPIKYRTLGPVTFLHKSFIPNFNESKAKFLSLLSNEIAKLIKIAVNSGARVVQIDESNILEQMPLKVTEFSPMLSGLAIYIKNLYSMLPPEIQTHLHIDSSNILLYLDELDVLDIDVLLLESARSSHDILSQVSGYKYQGEIGIGICDLSSYFTPTVKDIQANLKAAMRAFDMEKLWITYDVNSVYLSESYKDSVKNIHEAILVARKKFSSD